MWAAKESLDLGGIEREEGAKMWVHSGARRAMWSEVERVLKASRKDDAMLERLEDVGGIFRW